MYYHYIRIVLMGLFSLLGVMLHIQIGIHPAWYLYVASFLLALSHFLFGTVGLAFNQLKKGNLDQAEKIINQTRNPRFLTKRHRGYFYFTKGMISLQHEKLEESKTHLKMALETGLRSDTEMALVHLNLAHIHFVQKDLNNCRKFLAEAKKYPTSDPNIKTHIQNLENAVASQQN